MSTSDRAKRAFAIDGAERCQHLGRGRAWLADCINTAALSAVGLANARAAVNAANPHYLEETQEAAREGCFKGCPQIQFRPQVVECGDQCEFLTWCFLEDDRCDLALGLW